MEYKQIIYQPGKVARLILNRPRYLNAQSRQMLEEIDDAFTLAMQGDEVHVVILSGTGEHFSSGHDLGTPDEMNDRKERGYPADNLGLYERMHTTMFDNSLRWRNLPKPTIAMIKGYCIFGGWILASAMDIIFASEDALFLPAQLQYFSIPWDIGPRKAKELLFEHRFMTSWEAYQCGLVNRVFPKERLEDETLGYAERVADNWIRNPISVRTAKSSINHMMDTMGFSAELEAAFQSFFLAWGLTDSRTRQNKGDMAQTNIALRNLELTKLWLDSIR